MSSNIQLPLWCHKWWAYVGHRIYGTSREQILLKFASKKMDFSYMKAKVEVVYLSCPEVLFINHQNTATAAVDVILTWSKPLRREEKPVWWKKKKNSIEVQVTETPTDWPTTCKFAGVLIKSSITSKSIVYMYKSVILRWKLFTLLMRAMDDHGRG